MDPLLTDLYEFTMAAAMLAEGRAEAPATFSLFVRNLPPGRGYLVAAGIHDALRFLRDWSFDAGALDRLAATAAFDPAFFNWLAGLRFTGRVRAVPEGRLVFADEPLLEIDGPLGAVQLLETALLNLVTYPTAVATKCARCRAAAGEATLVDFGLRRAHGAEAGFQLARGGAITGFAATSNVAAAARYGLPASGTMAHSYVTALAGGQAAGELDAFRSFARRYPGDPVLLVDTWDTGTGVGHAITVARELAAGALGGGGRRLAGVRLDSGDLVGLAKTARAELDAAGLPEVAIFLSGGLDEYEITRIRAAGAPVDGYGVGTNVATAADAPALETVYKLVAVDGRPMAKRSTGKATLPGAKQVWRRPGFGGDVLALAGEPMAGAVGAGRAEPLLVAVDLEALPDDRAAVSAAHDRFESDWSALPSSFKDLTNPTRYEVERSEALKALTDSTIGTG
ncbi:MAG TPA: nicotinate phosphoribosyltransferase [Acidimicrobiia bacterium]|nr:nicotinate phosphoribosyltransferase [Acidimicrobiia bacterium]